MDPQAQPYSPIRLQICNLQTRCIKYRPDYLDQRIFISICFFCSIVKINKGKYLYIFCSANYTPNKWPISEPFLPIRLENSILQNKFVKHRPEYIRSYNKTKDFHIFVFLLFYYHILKNFKWVSYLDYSDLSVVIFGPAWDTDFPVQGNFDPLLPCPHFCVYFRLKIYQKLTIL